METRAIRRNRSRQVESPPNKYMKEAKCTASSDVESRGNLRSQSESMKRRGKGKGKGRGAPALSPVTAGVLWCGVSALFSTWANTSFLQRFESPVFHSLVRFLGAAFLSAVFLGVNRSTRLLKHYFVSFLWCAMVVSGSLGPAPCSLSRVQLAHPHPTPHVRLPSSFSPAGSTVWLWPRRASRSRTR